MTRWLLIFAIFVSALPFHADAVSTSKDVAIIVCAGSSCGPSITVNNATPTAGSTIQVSVNPGANPGNAGDFVTWAFGGTRYIGSYGDSFRDEDTGAANGPTTYSVEVPSEGNDYPVQYILSYWNYLGTPYPASNQYGNCTSNGYCTVAQTTVTVPASIPPVSLTAARPADLDTIPPGFTTPGQTIKVGPAGTCGGACDFDNVQDAVNHANSVGTDYAYIQVQGGYEYDGCWQAGAPGPTHWWFKGVGGAFPHLKPGSTCGGYLFQVNAAAVTIDNMELSDSQGINNVGTLRNNSCASITIRNVYIHDGGTGVIFPALDCTANPYTFTVLNSVFRRNGGFGGPAHNTYLTEYYEYNGGSPSTVIAKRSVFEGALAGHAFKTEAYFNTMDCNMLLESESEVHIGSTATLFENGPHQALMTNNLIVQGPYWRYNVDNQGSPSNAFLMQYSVGAQTTNVPNAASWWVLQNNIVINDEDGTHGSAIDQGASSAFFRTGFPMGPSMPYAWTNNVFIGPTGVPSGNTINGILSAYDGTPFGGSKGNISDVNFGNPSPSDSCPAAPGATACGYDTGTPNSNGNLFFSSRAAAAALNWPSSGTPLRSINVGPLGPVPYATWPFDAATFPMPSACTQPIGNVKIR
jgi:hypothetical protein